MEIPMILKGNEFRKREKPVIIEKYDGGFEKPKSKS